MNTHNSLLDLCVKMASEGRVFKHFALGNQRVLVYNRVVFAEKLITVIKNLLKTNNFIVQHFEIISRLTSLLGLSVGLKFVKLTRL